MPLVFPRFFGAPSISVAAISGSAPFLYTVVRTHAAFACTHDPPLALSPTELMALVFSRELLKPLDGTEIKASLDSALNKAATALPAEGTTYVQQMQKSANVTLEWSSVPELPSLWTDVAKLKIILKNLSGP